VISWNHKEKKYSLNPSLMQIKKFFGVKHVKGFFFHADGVLWF